MSFTAEQTKAWLERLKAAGIEEASLELRHILLAAMDANQAETLVQRRVQREPLSYILGDKPFWTLDLKVNPDVLTPRADTETLVDTVLKQLPDRRAVLHIADFGTGSGAILLALLAELPEANGLGIDISESALQIAMENAARNQLADRAVFRAGNWAEGIEAESVDIAVSNPPYVASDVIETLEPEVRDHEPRLALDGGKDGLDIYRLLIPQLFRVLKPGGLMAVEIGFDQVSAVTALAEAAGFLQSETVKDLGGNNRIIWARKRDP